MTYTFVVPVWVVLVYGVFQVVGTAVSLHHTYWLRRKVKAGEASHMEEWLYKPTSKDWR